MRRLFVQSRLAPLRQAFWRPERISVLGGRGLHAKGTHRRPGLNGQTLSHDAPRRCGDAARRVYRAAAASGQGKETGNGGAMRADGTRGLSKKASKSEEGTSPLVYLRSGNRPINMGAWAYSDGPATHYFRILEINYRRPLIPKPFWVACEDQDL